MRKPNAVPTCRVRVEGDPARTYKVAIDNPHSARRGIATFSGHQEKSLIAGEYGHELTVCLPDQTYIWCYRQKSTAEVVFPRDADLVFQEAKLVKTTVKVRQ